MSRSRLDEVREKSRKKILSAALDLFAAQGVEGTSIDQIAKRAKISKGLLYNYFKSKDDLLRVLLLHGFEKFLTSRNAFWEDLEDPSDQLRRGLRQWVALLRKDIKYWRLLLAVSIHPGSYSKLLEASTEYREKYEKKLKELMLRIGSKEPQRHWLMLDVFIDGLLYGFLRSPGTFPLEKTLDQFMADFITMVRK